MTKEEVEYKFYHNVELIQALKNENNKLAKEYLSFDDVSWTEKFAVWMESNIGEHSDWTILNQDYPNINAWLSKMDLNRYQTYNLLDMLYDEITYVCFVYNPDEGTTDWVYDDDIEIIIGIMQEMMSKNIYSFKHHW